MSGMCDQGMVKVPLGKGCILLLTQAEYLRAIKRGKAIRRVEKSREREEAGNDR